MVCLVFLSTHKNNQNYYELFPFYSLSVLLYNLSILRSKQKNMKGGVKHAGN